MNSDHPLWARMSIPDGRSVFKESGSYVQVQNPTEERLLAADAVYLGGHEYEVDDIVAAELTAAGYGAWLTAI